MIDVFWFISLGFQKSQSELTLYVKHEGTNTLIISLYVDDLLIIGSNPKQINKFKLEMKKIFEMTDLGLMSYFFDIEIKQTQDEVFICKKKVCKGDTKKISDGGLQSNEYSYESKGEAGSGAW